MTRIILKVTALTLCLAVLSFALSITEPNQRLSSPSSLPSSLGIYMGNQGPKVALIDATLGRPIGFEMTFSDGSRWNSIANGATSQCNAARSSRLRLIATYNMLPNHGGSLERGARGDYDRYAYEFGRALVVSGCSTAVLRVGWEFNGDWFAWKARGNAVAFVSYWRNIVDSMRKVRGQHFEFLWNPTIAHSKYSSLDQTYPGDRYVDIVGLDVYDMNDGRYPGHLKNWYEILNATYGLNWLLRFAAIHRKLMAIPEWGLGWGSHGGGDDAIFVTKMVQWLQANKVMFATVWDYGSSPLLSTQSPKATAALVAACSV